MLSLTGHTRRESRSAGLVIARHAKGDRDGYITPPASGYTARCRNEDTTREDEAQPDGIDLFLSLIVDAGVNHVAGEHIATRQECVIAFEHIKPISTRDVSSA